MLVRRTMVRINTPYGAQLVPQKRILKIPLYRIDMKIIQLLRGIAVLFRGPKELDDRNRIQTNRISNPPLPRPDPSPATYNESPKIICPGIKCNCVPNTRPPLPDPSAIIAPTPLRNDASST